jgi:Protein of unknown function DUF262
MSVGELTNLYRDGELDIQPKFQRFFRWSGSQKASLVESLLLGIPIPPILVAQREDRGWSVVDGLQRVATLLELQGELRGRDGLRLDMLVLEGTLLLPALEGCRWDSSTRAKSLSPAQRLEVKRARIDVKVLGNSSGPELQFDLFRRLNLLASPLSRQEIRNALLVAQSERFYDWLESLASFPQFRQAIAAVGEKDLEERRDLELVIRFISLYRREPETIASEIRNEPQFLDDESVRLVSHFPNGDSRSESDFKATFATLVQSVGEDVFRPWRPKQQRFSGPFSLPAFDVFALGLGFHIGRGSRHRADLTEMVHEYWSDRPGAARSARTVADRLVSGRNLTSP